MDPAATPFEFFGKLGKVSCGAAWAIVGINALFVGGVLENESLIADVSSIANLIPENNDQPVLVLPHLFYDVTRYASVL